MKNAIIKSFAVIIGLIFFNGTFAQPAKDTFSVAGGKWAVCADTAQVKNYDCANPYTGFEFFKDGRYKEYPKTISDPGKQFLQGVWTLNSNVFTIDQDDEPGTKELPKTYEIIWVDKNHFYSSNKVGELGPKMFVYFQRVP